MAWAAGFQSDFGEKLLKYASTLKIPITRCTYNQTHTHTGGVNLFFKTYGGALPIPETLTCHRLDCPNPNPVVRGGTGPPRPGTGPNNERGSPPDWECSTSCGTSLCSTGQGPSPPSTRVWPIRWRQRAVSAVRDIEREGHGRSLSVTMELRHSWQPSPPFLPGDFPGRPESGHVIKGACPSTALTTAYCSSPATPT